VSPELDRPAGRIQDDLQLRDFIGVILPDLDLSGSHNFPPCSSESGEGTFEPILQGVAIVRA
jgi:hypothetical protein